jgi:toxin ParE1/3/4
MTRIEFAPEVAGDFERVLDHLVQHRVDDAASRIQDIVSAIDTLERNPMIGRPAGPHNRELVIGRGARGYLALYRYIAEIDILFVLAVRRQSEAGYADQPQG